SPAQLYRAAPTTPLSHLRAGVVAPSQKLLRHRKTNPPESKDRLVALRAAPRCRLRHVLRSWCSYLRHHRFHSGSAPASHKTVVPFPVAAPGGSNTSLLRHRDARRTKAPMFLPVAGLLVLRMKERVARHSAVLPIARWWDLETIPRVPAFARSALRSSTS